MRRIVLLAALAAPAAALDTGLAFRIASAPTVDEDAGSVTLLIERTAGTAAAEVDWATADATATAGVHYTACGGRLAWAAGDLTTRSVSVPLLDDVVAGPGRGFAVRLGVPRPVRAFDWTWHVDAVAGSDAGDGTTPATAFATIARALAATAERPRTRIRLARGGVWREQLRLLAADCQVDAYGSGPAPVIDGADEIPAGDWAPAPGRANAFAATRLGLNTSACLQTVWQDGVRLTRAADAAACDATPGSFWAPIETAYVKNAPYTLLVHPAGGGDPRTDGCRYETQAREWCVYLGTQSALGAAVIGIDARRSAHHNGNIQVGRGGTAIDCVLRHGAVHALYIDSGSVRGCTSLDGELGHDFVANKGSATDGSVWFERCDVRNGDTVGPVLKPAYFVHGNTMASVRFDDCVSVDRQTGFGVGYAKGTVSFTRCVATCDPSVPTFRAFFPGQNPGADIADITLDACRSDGQGQALYAYTMNAGSHVAVDRLRSVTRGDAIAMIVRTAALSAERSSFHAVSGSAYGVVYAQLGAAVAFRRCVVDGFRWPVRIFSGCTYDAADNLYRGGLLWDWQGTLHPTLAAFATASGEEAGSAIGSPAWTSDPALDHAFVPSASSPALAIDAGWRADADDVPPFIGQVAIADDDCDLGFSATAASVVEAAGAALLTVARSGSARDAVSVAFACAPGTAAATTDYTPVSGTLTWGAGDAGTRTIIVPLAADSLQEGDETFTVLLSPAAPGATVTVRPTCVVTVLDDDSPTPTGGGSASGTAGTATGPATPGTPTASDAGGGCGVGGLAALLAGVSPWLLRRGRARAATTH